MIGDIIVTVSVPLPIILESLYISNGSAMLLSVLDIKVSELDGIPVLWYTTNILIPLLNLPVGILHT